MEQAEDLSQFFHIVLITFEAITWVKVVTVWSTTWNVYVVPEILKIF